mgnify:FL=1|jgi:hypothetical protein
MKIRHNFVSNSSSSSFVVFVTEEKWQETLESECPENRDLIKEHWYSQTILGHKMMGYDTWHSPDYSWCAEMDDEEIEALEDFCSAARKNDPDSFTVDVDF